MSNTEIKEKYGIEPIMKEMWVWDNDKEDAKLCFVLAKDNSDCDPFVGYYSNKNFVAKQNASETNPNDKEPKVGDKGYFWDDEESYFYGTLYKIDHKVIQPYQSMFFQMEHFSHDKQPWMG